MYLSFFLFIWKEANIGDFLQMWRLTSPERSKSARLPQKCESSRLQNFEIYNLKKEAILRNLLKKWKVECRAEGLVSMRFAIFPCHLSKVSRQPRKSEARSYEVLRTQNHRSKPDILMLQNATLSGNQRPDLWTCLVEMSLVRRCRAECIFADPLQMSHACHRFWDCCKTHTFGSATESDARTTKSGPWTCGAFRILTWTCTSRHNAVHFFDIWTSKSGPRPPVSTLLTWKCAVCHNGMHFFKSSTSKSDPTLRCFYYFDLIMCYAPQSRALFRHLNFQKCSKNEVFWAFWLPNRIHPTAACNFSWTFAQLAPHQPL